MHYASHYNAFQILDYFLKYNFKYGDYSKNINEKNSDFGWTPLMVCVCFQAEECLKVILNGGGIDWNIRDNKNKNVIQLAKMNNSINCLAILEKEFNMNKENEKNNEINENYLKNLLISEKKEIIDYISSKNYDLQDFNKNVIN